jgi:eukaryotic-like serine/threonine-protein kinase
MTGPRSADETTPSEDEVELSTPAPVFLPGQVVDGRYLVDRLIARGGMGEVYAARHLLLGKRVAIKTLRASASSENHRQRFRREAHVLASLANPHIVTAFDFGSCPDGELFLVMELLEGVSLRALLHEEKRLVAPRAVRLVYGACEGLIAAHAVGAVHRDLKPENIFVTRGAGGGEMAKILDFGLVRLREPGDRWRTRTGSALGTIGYMSPEQARGDNDVDGRTDIYALSAILYEALAGCRTHEAESPLALVHKIINERPAPLREACVDVPARLSDVVQRGLAPDPKDRYQTVEELAAALRPFLPAASRQEAPGGSTLPLDPAPVRRLARPWVVAAALVGGPVATTVVLGWHSPQDRSQPAQTTSAAAARPDRVVEVKGSSSARTDPPPQPVAPVPAVASAHPIPSSSSSARSLMKRPAVVHRAAEGQPQSESGGFDRDNPYANGKE